MDDDLVQECHRGHTLIPSLSSGACPACEWEMAQLQELIRVAQLGPEQVGAILHDPLTVMKTCDEIRRWDNLQRKQRMIREFVGIAEDREDFQSLLTPLPGEDMLTYKLRIINSILKSEVPHGR